MSAHGQDRRKGSPAALRTTGQHAGRGAREWLGTPSSKSVGFKGADGKARESVGHTSGRHIVRILRKRNEELTAGDYANMRTVIGFVRRHSARRPANIYTSRWRYSLMNWGHDPTKEDER